MAKYKAGLRIIEWHNVESETEYVDMAEDLYRFDAIKGLVIEALELEEVPDEIKLHLKIELDALERMECEFEEYKEDSKFLSYLEESGVDNWSGYIYVQERMEEDE